MLILMPNLSFHTEILKLQGSPEEHVVQISPKGFIDSSSYRFFERALESAFHRKTRFAALDLSEVHYINSTGISAIIRYFSLYRDRKGLLALVSVPKSVGLSMHLLGVTSLVPFHKDLSGARSQFVDVLAGKDKPNGQGLGDGTRRGKIRVPVRSNGSVLKDSCVFLVTPKANRFTRILNLRYRHLNDHFKVFHDKDRVLEVIGKRRPDVVVVDSRMDTDGDLVRRLKVHPERSLISIIKIYPKEIVDVEAISDFKIWENDYLVDPFEILELFSLAEAELLRVPKDRKVFSTADPFRFPHDAGKHRKGEQAK